MFRLSSILIATGLVFGYLEMTFYQYIDQNGVLVESWFLPLSFLFVFIGAAGLLGVALKAIRLALRRST